jgi:hypothetical protein
MTVGVLAAGLLVGVLSPAVASAAPNPASSNQASSSSKPASSPEAQSKIESAMKEFSDPRRAYGVTEDGAAIGPISLSDMYAAQRSLNHLAELSKQATAVVSGTSSGSGTSAGSGSVGQMAKNLKDNS